MGSHVFYATSELSPCNIHLWHNWMLKVLQTEAALKRHQTAVHIIPDALHPSHPHHEPHQEHTAVEFPNCYDKNLQTDFIYFTRCTDTGVIVTHALSFYRPLAPLLLLTHAQLAVVTQSCALLYIAAHCDLLLQWRYCSCDAYCSRYLIVLLRYISQACWVPCSPRLDFFHCTAIVRLVAANRLRSPLPLCLIPLKVIHCNVLKWQALVNYFSSETT